MNDYYLFIDTETSGLPKRWNKPYAREGNWPFIVQVSWIICTTTGIEILQKDHLINEDDFTVSQASFKIHGFSDEYRKLNGKPRKVVMEDLAADLRKYQPMIIGHFTELDLHMIGADFFRSDVNNPAVDLPAFCTMKATAKLVKNPSASFLRLGQLYEILFKENLKNPHNALYDSIATARCFFELREKGIINDSIILAQQASLDKIKQESRRLSLVLPIILFGLLTVLISLLI